MLPPGRAQARRNTLPPLVLALKCAFLQCVIYTPSALSRERPVQCQESQQCCCCVFQLLWDQELPWGTTHLCTSTWGRPNPERSWWPPQHRPCPCWAVLGRAPLFSNFPGGLKDHRVLSPWGQRCKSSQDQGCGARASCRHTACLRAAARSHSVTEPLWLSPRARLRLRGEIQSIRQCLLMGHLTSRSLQNYSININNATFHLLSQLSPIFKCTNHYRIVVFIST